MSQGFNTSEGVVPMVQETQDFHLMLAQHDSGLPEAVHALYYLPQNYKLVILNDTATQDDIMSWAEQGIIDRIKFKQATGMPSKDASPFSSASAVLYTGSTPVFGEEETPTVLVSEGAADIASNDRLGFTVAAGNPEALATAVLRIARAQA